MSGVAQVEVREGEVVVRGSLHRVRAGRHVELRAVAPPAPEVPAERPLQVARMLAVAHAMAALLDAGRVPNAAELAQRLGFSRARVSQLLDLTLLAPAIQAELLALTTETGRDPISERELRSVLRHRCWVDQQQAFDQLARDAGLR